MQSKSIVAIVLILCGVGCILLSFGAITYLYHEHGAKLTNASDEEHFVFFVGLPSFAVFVVGVVLAAIGIKTVINDKGP